MKAAKTRNLIAILAIALTTLLFTSLFTIAMSINDGFQESNFRQCGGWSHGGFKYLTEQQYDELKDDPLIKEYGLRRFLGMPREEPFTKSHVEVGYSDAKQAHWMYCDPIEGRLPQEGTNEAATDLRVLELLGVDPVLGNEFTVTFDVDGHETTQTFTLCGWWEYDEAIVANHILIPESRVDAILAEVGVDPNNSADGMTGTWNMDVMFSNSFSIRENLETILANHGYQTESRSAGDNYITIGVNWGYSGAQLTDSIDPMTVLAITAVLLLIIFTGYLIIYNVFQISVVGDIRFYGLLKTIGTTGKQIKRIIRQQALLLSAAGIPLGLLLGWVIGAKLTPVIVARLNGIVSVVSISPIIFIGAAIFALFTVLLSCRKPGKMAARVSPVEAVRYTDASGVKKKSKKSGKGVSLFAMARVNLGRNRSKTVITILSLSLSVVLLNTTVMFTNGFDMDKYLARNSVSDFIVSDAGYFQPGTNWSSEAVPEELMNALQTQGGITEGGQIYGKTTPVQEFITEDYYRAAHGQWNSEETLDALIAMEERNGDGQIADNAQLYGMEKYALDKLTVLDGDISKLYEPGGRYIAAVYEDDDYGNPYMDSHWARLGDTITLRYLEEWEYYNPVTGEIYEDPGTIQADEPYRTRAVKYRDVEYEVAALVLVPHALSYRYFGQDAFVLNDQTFIQDTGTSTVMLYAFDTTEESNANMEAFLADYTQNVNPAYDYESKATYVAQFESFRSMFLLLGSVLSFIVGLVGVLNFINAILTGIITRRREFAMLQAIGMTGRQLQIMLVDEGLLYALGSVLFSLVLSLVTGPLASTALSSMFWFFTYRLTLTPILVVAPLFAILGALVPLLVYRHVAKATIVERLRENET